MNIHTYICACVKQQHVRHQMLHCRPPQCISIHVFVHLGGIVSHLLGCFGISAALEAERSVILVLESVFSAVKKRGHIFPLSFQPLSGPRARQPEALEPPFFPGLVCSCTPLQEPHCSVRQRAFPTKKKKEKKSLRSEELKRVWFQRGERGVAGQKPTPTINSRPVNECKDPSPAK